MQPERKNMRLEWGCRILLSIQLILTGSGYIKVWQTKYQLMSPLVPQSAVNTIISDVISYSYKPCFLLSASLLVALWLYFLNKKLAVVVMSSISILSFEIWMRFFYY